MGLPVPASIFLEAAFYHPIYADTRNCFGMTSNIEGFRREAVLQLPEQEEGRRDQQRWMPQDRGAVNATPKSYSAYAMFEEARWICQLRQDHQLRALTKGASEPGMEVLVQPARTCRQPRGELVHGNAPREQCTAPNTTFAQLWNAGVQKQERSRRVPPAPVPVLLKPNNNSKITTKTTTTKKMATHTIV